MYVYCKVHSFFNVVFFLLFNFLYIIFLGHSCSLFTTSKYVTSFILQSMSGYFLQPFVSVVVLLLLILAGDVETNPGPGELST